MPAITEGRLTFTFPDDWDASKFDEWSFYRNQFQGICGGSKAIDVLAIERDCCWLIEIKDYRHQRRTKSGHVAEEVAGKVRDTLAALAAARVNANDTAERAAANAALRRSRIRVVLHLESADRRSRLFSRLLISRTSSSASSSASNRLTRTRACALAPAWPGASGM